jgi:hypothetical protein
MKYLLLVSLLFLRVSEPEIKFNLKRHYYPVKLGETLKKRIDFINVGTNPLIIKDISSTCTCTVGSFSKEAILPNKIGFIEITFHSVGKMLGVQTQPLIIETNSLNKKFKKLNIEFEIVQ